MYEAAGAEGAAACEVAAPLDPGGFEVAAELLCAPAPAPQERPLGFEWRSRASTAYARQCQAAKRATAKAEGLAARLSDLNARPEYEFGKDPRGSAQGVCATAFKPHVALNVCARNKPHKRLTQVSDLGENSRALCLYMY